MSNGAVGAGIGRDCLVFHHNLVFVVVAAAALLLPLTNAPEPATWIASLLLLIAMGTAVARPARRGRLPPGIP